MDIIFERICKWTNGKCKPAAASCVDGKRAWLSVQIKSLAGMISSNLTIYGTVVLVTNNVLTAESEILQQQTGSCVTLSPPLFSMVETKL
jgi:hypothetical protein